MSLSKELEKKVWEKGIKIPNRNPEEYRLDMSGAIIYRNRREHTNMAWQADHIFPQAFLRFYKVPQEKIDNLNNLQPLQSSNNEAKSDDIVMYNQIMIADEKKEKNIEKERYCYINTPTFHVLMAMYKDYFNGMSFEEAYQKYINAK